MASISRAKKTMKRLRALITKHELKTEQKLNRNDLNISTSNKQIEYVKNITLVKPSKDMVSNLLSNRSLPVRTPGDGMEDTPYVGRLRTPGVGEETNCLITKEKSSLNTGFISSYDENEKRNEKVDLNECAIFENADISFTDDVSSDEDDSASELEINVLEIHDDKSLLNECVMYEDDEESVPEDDSDCESICELEMNIIEVYENNTKLEASQIKAMFTKTDLNARLINEDDSMESFMNTFYRE
jgi:hypothetical protein